MLREAWHLPTDVERLPLIVAQREHEPAESVLLRLAIANGYFSIPRLLSATPNFPKKLVVEDLTRQKCIALAERLGGLAEGPLEKATPHRTLPGITLYGHYFKKFRTIGKARVCPACLAADTKNLAGRELLRPYRRNWWEIHNIGACPFHSTALIDSCPKCGTRLRLTKSAVSCACDPRVDLRRVTGVRVPNEDIVHDRWLLGRLGICEQHEHAFLDMLSPDIGSHLCLIIGTLIESGFQLSRTCTLRASYSVRARSLGWRVLQEWPHSFDAFLDQLIEHNNSTNKLKAMRTASYSGLYQHLRRERSPELEVVYEAIKAHAARTHLVAESTRFFGHKLALGDKVALHHAAKLAGCGPGRFVAISKTLNLPSLGRAASGTRTVPTGHVEVVKNFWDSSIEAVQVAKILGCNHKTVDMMIEMGVLRVRLKGKVAVSTLFDRGDFDMLLKAISAPLEELDELADDLITVRQAVAIVWRGEATILKGLLSGDIRAVARSPGKEGFKGMILRRSEVIDAIPKLTGKALSFSVLKKIGWEAGTIRYLQRLGYLKHERRYYVDVAELKAFQKQYVAMKEMLRWEGEHSVHGIRKILKAGGIEPEIRTQSNVTGFWPRGPAQRALRS